MAAGAPLLLTWLQSDLLVIDAGFPVVLGTDRTIYIIINAVIGAAR